jgi:alkyl hydroperoxide reductase subunit AhpC
MNQSGKDNAETACKVFIIDPQCIIRAQMSYSQSLGYSFDELKKVIVTLQSAKMVEHTSSSLWNRSDEIISRYQFN